MPPIESTRMAFEGFHAESDWTLAPKYVDPSQWGANVHIGEPCAHYSKLHTSCGDSHGTEACWYLPASDHGGVKCQGADSPSGKQEMPSKWCAVTDLCFSQNSTSPGLLPPWGSLVGIAFADLSGDETLNWTPVMY